MGNKTILLSAATAWLLGLAGASAQMLTISEVYGGGGNSGSTYSNDFIELYNYGTIAIDMSDYALYYASAVSDSPYAAATPAGTTNNFTTTLSGNLLPGSYYLVAEFQGLGGTLPLTDVNAVGTINLSSSAGKVALGLVSTTPTFTFGPITAANHTIDFIGYGSAAGSLANQYEGTGPAPTLKNTTSDAKASPPGASVNNATDYTPGPPTPMGSGALTVGVPEPSTWVELAGGLVLLSSIRRCRRTA